MISLAKPTLKQQAEIAIQTELGGWFANPCEGSDAKLGSELHKAGTLKNNRENYNKLPPLPGVRQSLLDAVAHLPVSVETFWEGSEFHYKITENQGGKS